ncbi:hypothetical protein M885DRAFT_333372 [Pelagophyceae sp. CCMP2097]|nr:hypothetical protein M885DRAFT_333372 [Pelagophyceae sp. CCMP2097]
MQQSSSLAGFFDRDVSLAATRRGVDPEDLGRHRLKKPVSSASRAAVLYGFDAEAWQRDTFDLDHAAGPGDSKFQKYMKQTTLPVVARARRTLSQGDAKLGRLRRGPTKRPLSDVDSALRSMGHVPAGAEQPNLRAEALSLEQRYSQAMQIVDGRASGRAGGLVALMDRPSETWAGADRELVKDFLKCCSSVEEDFGKRRFLAAAVGATSDKSEFSRAAGPTAPRPTFHGTSDKGGFGEALLEAAEDPFFKDAQGFHGVADALGLTRADWLSERDEVSAAVYEVKWANKTCAELAAQVTVGCLEHGRLLEAIRRRYGTIFHRLQRLHADSLRRLDAAVSALGATREQRRSEEQDDSTSKRALREKHESDVADLLARQQAELSKQRDLLTDSESAASKMGETLRCLRGVVREMQGSSEVASRAALKNKHGQTQAELEEARFELAQLRPLRAAAGRVPILEGEVRIMRSNAAQLHLDLASARQMVSELQKAAAMRLADEEHVKAEARSGREGELQRGVRYDDDDEDQVCEDPMASVLCLKCQKSLDDMANIRAAVGDEAAAEPPKLVCHAFRSLLPNLNGFRPDRQLVWVRRCMRSILHAVGLDHAEPEGSAVATMYLTTRFPEFVYAYFEPDGARLAALKKEERRLQIASADDDRWGFYYGVKLLCRESDEAKLFWALLDETHGDDFLRFIVHCGASLRKSAGRPLATQAGAAWKGARHAAVADAAARDGQRLVDVRRMADGDGVVTAREAGKGVKNLEFEGSDDWGCWEQLAADGDADVALLGGQETLWVSLPAALKAAEQVLLKANPKLREAAFESIRAMTVESKGRAAKWGATASHCVDAALWSRVLAHLYREEQAHRRAAVRLMFETALAGTIAVHAPDYGSGRAPCASTASLDLHAPQPTVDVPQFISIIRTLWPATSTAYACRLFRDCHALGNGRVDCAAFLRVAEDSQFFGQSLSLPRYVTAMAELDLDTAERFMVGSVVHLRHRLMQPLFKRVELALPEGLKARFSACRAAFESAVEANTVEHGLMREIDGMQPLAAYKRILAFVAHVRLLSYELGSDYPQGSGAGYGARLRTKKLSGADFVVATQRELRNSELQLIDYDEPESWNVLAKLQQRLAISRVVHAWRRRKSHEAGPPAAIRLLMRRGYMSGRGDIRDRQCYKPAAWVQDSLALLFEQWLVHVVDGTHSTTAGFTFVGFVHSTYLARYGVPSLAERALHDLYFNARHFATALPRARLFCVFSGLCKSVDLRRHAPTPGAAVSAADPFVDDSAAYVPAASKRRREDEARSTEQDLEDVETTLALRADEAAAFYVHAVALRGAVSAGCAWQARCRVASVVATCLGMPECLGCRSVWVAEGVPRPGFFSRGPCEDFLWKGGHVMRTPLLGPSQRDLVTGFFSESPLAWLGTFGARKFVTGPCHGVLLTVTLSGRPCLGDLVRGTILRGTWGLVTRSLSQGFWHRNPEGPCHWDLTRGSRERGPFEGRRRRDLVVGNLPRRQRVLIIRFSPQAPCHGDLVAGTFTGTCRWGLVTGALSKDLVARPFKKSLSREPCHRNLATGFLAEDLVTRRRGPGGRPFSRCIVVRISSGDTCRRGPCQRGPAPSMSTRESDSDS